MYEIIKISLITFMFCALGQDKGMIFYWYQQLIKRLPHYLYYPLGGCYMCFTGQICFWYFIITKPFNIVELLFFISAGIMSAVIWNKLYCWLRDENR
jgi:hypothetical protein